MTYGDPAPRSVQIRPFNDSVTLDWIRRRPFHPDASTLLDSHIRNFVSLRQPNCNALVFLITIWARLSVKRRAEGGMPSLIGDNTSLSTREKDCSIRRGCMGMRLWWMHGDLFRSVSCELFVSASWALLGDCLPRLSALGYEAYRFGTFFAWTSSREDRHSVELPFPEQLGQTCEFSQVQYS
jgi:hypothetical protein